ncbi:hypothetical protein [Halarcobacter sp.]|uniref:hypothetical protein n=1 Tax=Halarcobacter sp. TaxID=2321133 RepID=UPI003A953C64
MKKLVLVMLSLASLVFTGCSVKTEVVKDEKGQVVFNQDGTPVLKEYIKGAISGKMYDKEVVKTLGVAVYKVVEKGVVTFATKEQIEDNQLDKVADVIEYVYSVDTSTGKLVE